MSASFEAALGGLEQRPNYPTGRAHLLANYSLAPEGFQQAVGDGGFDNSPMTTTSRKRRSSSCDNSIATSPGKKSKSPVVKLMRGLMTSFSIDSEKSSQPMTALDDSDEASSEDDSDDDDLVALMMLQQQKKRRVVMLANMIGNPIHPHPQDRTRDGGGHPARDRPILRGRRRRPPCARPPRPPRANAALRQPRVRPGLRARRRRPAGSAFAPSSGRDGGAPPAARPPSSGPPPARDGGAPPAARPPSSGASLAARPAVDAVAARLARAEPPLRAEAVHYLLRDPAAHPSPAVLELAAYSRRRSLAAG
ncbi:serine/arginine repetitive matrix protein 1-like [Panicum virgatum]|uniref:serine/arginine repetitive matrix protein 1-like n=1 Tax=Panicum virgatum TaxID=38727 RepID=UPI0019D5B7EA|nr:serine/arginine repetitive matrix protein 1-like [Panicum virgatum]